MEDWKRFAQRFFDALHLAWMDGNLDRLAPFFSQESRKEKAEWRAVLAKLLGKPEPEAVIRAVSGRVVPLCWLEQEHAVQARFWWSGRCCLQAGKTRKAVERQHRLALQLAKTAQGWVMAEIRGRGDGREKMELAPETEQGDAAMKPAAVQKSVAVPESGAAVPEPDAGGARAEAAQPIVQPVVQVYGASGYNAEKAVAYAEHYWNSANPAYPLFDDDCTNFISQCLHAGGIPMIFSRDKTRGWWMRTGKNASWSFSWSVAHSLYLLLKSGAAPMRAVQKNGPEELVPGDVICYDFDGDGRFQHNTIVVAKDAANMPLVNAHSANSRMRFWAYLDSTAYTPNIRYAFFHIRGL